MRGSPGNCAGGGDCRSPSIRRRGRGPRHRVEDLPGEELIPGAAVEALHPGVLPGAAGVDVAGLDVVEHAPVTDGEGDELRAVVAPNEARHAAGEDRRVQHFDDVVRSDGAGDRAAEGSERI